LMTRGTSYRWSRGGQIRRFGGKQVSRLCVLLSPPFSWAHGIFGASCIVRLPLSMRLLCACFSPPFLVLVNSLRWLKTPPAGLPHRCRCARGAQGERRQLPASDGRGGPVRGGGLAVRGGGAGVDDLAIPPGLRGGFASQRIPGQLLSGAPAPTLLLYPLSSYVTHAHSSAPSSPCARPSSRCSCSGSCSSCSSCSSCCSCASSFLTGRGR